MRSDETERVPYCDECAAISVPTDDGTCGECGETVRFLEGEV